MSKNTDDGKTNMDGAEKNSSKMSLEIGIEFSELCEKFWKKKDLDYDTAIAMLYFQALHTMNYLNGKLSECKDIGPKYFDHYVKLYGWKNME